jgi:hypothetical protein
MYKPIVVAAITFSGTSGIPQYGKNVIRYCANVSVIIHTLDGVIIIILVHAYKNATTRPMAAYI